MKKEYFVDVAKDPRPACNQIATNGPFSSRATAEAAAVGFATNGFAHVKIWEREK